MSRVFYAVCAGFLCPVFFQPLWGQSARYEDPEIVRPTTRDEFLLKEIDRIRTEKSRIQAAESRKAIGKLILSIRARQSAESGLELPADDKAELDRIRKELDGQHAEGTGAGRTPSGGPKLGEAGTSPDGLGTPKSHEEFEERFEKWRQAEKAGWDLSFKVAVGRATEAEQRESKRIEAGRDRLRREATERMKEYDRLFPADKPKP